MISVSGNQVLAGLVYESMITEVNAYKPGNISQYSEGHNMTLNDFYRSAEITTPILCNADLSVGERILASVKKTREEIGCNTNLGIILLFAPLIYAFERVGRNVLQIRKQIKNVIERLKKQETIYIYEAIRLANPGGLGQGQHFDVHCNIPGTVLEAMEEAKSYDNIALQYTNGYHEVFKVGYPLIKDYNLRWNSVEWASVICYLAYLSHYTDSHIQRKFGSITAESIKTRALSVYNNYKQYRDPEEGIPVLKSFDKELKKSNINPGTSADLTAVTIFVFRLFEG